MNNYNSLSLGISSYLKKWSSGSVGSPPTTSSIRKSASLQWFAAILFLFIGISNYAQTTLIDPAGDGGFNNGTTFASNGWTVANNASSVNKWATGTAVTTSPFAGRSAYISQNNGTTTSYDLAASTRCYFYRDVAIPAGSAYIPLSFTWQCNGEGSWDLLQVFVAPTTVTPVGDVHPGSGTALIPTDLTGATQLGFFQTSTTVQNASLVVPSSFAGQTVRIIFMWKSDTSFGTQPPAAVDNISLLSYTTAPTFTATALGGLWSSAATWVGGIVPGTGTNVNIPSGSIVTVDQALNYGSINVDGTMQWNGSTNAMTLAGDLTIGATGKFLPHTTGGTGQALTIAGNLTNNGYANLAMASTAVTFNGSGSTLGGSGIFAGDGTKGIIRALLFGTTGSNAITTSQNLIATAAGAVSAGSLNTNGKLTLDNTAQIYGQALNLQVANLAVTNMGTTAYSVAPVVFGASVTQWDAITGTANTLYVSGSNVYRCTAAASIGASAPTHTSGIVDNLLWIGTTGTLGNPFQFNSSVSVGTQVFYGSNLYVCTVAGIPSSAAPPVHTSGTAVSGAATFLYVGTPATASVNFDATTGTVRSLNLTNPGSGLSAAPSVAFSVGVLAGTGAGAAATAVYIQQVAGSATFLMQKSGIATITGGLTINSDQGTIIATSNPQASSGIGAITTSNGGVAYTSAPTVGFAGPTALNLVVDPGSGYTTTPTVNVTGGTLVSGTALTTSNFTIAVNNGTVQAVYLNGSTTATYSVPPTLTLSTGNATIDWPAGCWPAATATVGSNGQVTNFTVTSPGFGYVAAPTIGLSGGGFVTAATAPTARVGLYNLTLNFFTPAASAVVSADDVVIPDTRKMNNLTLAGNGNGLNLANDLTLYGTSPLSLTASASTPGNILDLGGHNLNFTWNSYAGSTSTFGTTNTYIKNGSMSVTGRGGASTFNFPFSGTFTWFAGSTPTANSTGSSVTRVTVSDTAAPTNAVTTGTGIALGNRAFRVQLGQIGTGGFASSPATGTNPQVTLGFNSQDGLSVTQNSLFVADGTSLTGPWTVRSTSYGASGALPATGTKQTATTAPGPIVPTSNSLYAWATTSPAITSFAPTTLCAASGTFTITGTNLTGVTAVAIGGTAVTSFTVVSDTQITGFAGVGTSGFASVTKNGVTITGTDAITVSPAPNAPSVTTPPTAVTVGTMVSLTASGTETTFNWYSTATGGTAIFTGDTYNAPYCASTDIYVAQSNGSCEGPRTLVHINVTPITISATTSTFCGTGGTTTLSIAPLTGATYAWTSLTPSATINSGATSDSVNVTITQTSDFQLVVTGPNGCTTTVLYSVGVYALPSATVTTSASGVCPGTTATINSGLVAGNFISSAIPHAPLTPPVTATTLVNAGVMNVTPDISYGFAGDLDDAGWSARPIGFNFNFFGTTYTTINIGTNGTVFFGAPLDASATDFTFTTLPSTVEPFNMVAVLAMDNNLAGATGGAIRHWTEGVAPNRRFVVMYDNVQEFGDATKFSTAQAIFYETTGIIEVHVTSSTNVDRVKLVGVNNGNGTVGVLAYASGTTATTNPQNPITNPFAYRFTPPYNYTTVWTADEGEGPFVIASGTNVFSQTVSPTVTTTYTISYTNQTTGCTNALNSAQVEMVILGNTAPTGLNTVSSLANPICPGSSTTLSTDYTGSPDGLTYQWQEDGGSGFADIVGATSATYVAAPTAASTTYRVRIRSCGNVAGESFSAPYTVTLVDAVITSSTGATRCGNGPVSLTAAGTGTQVSWYANAAGGSPLFTGSPWNIASIGTTTTYYVASEVTSPNFCSGVRVPVTVTVTSAPPVSLSSASATICQGSSTGTVTLTSVPGDYTSYVWTPSTGVSGDAASGWVFNPTVTTTYTLNATNPGPADCVNALTFVVTVNANAAAPTVTPPSATLGCTATTPVALSVGSSFTNPTPPASCSTDPADPIWPSATYTPAACDGSFATITTVGFSGEYSSVNVTPGNFYSFTSGNATITDDRIQITNSDGSVVYAAGPSPISWLNNVGATNIRFYSEHGADCLEDSTSRDRRISCTNVVTAVFSPTTGLFTDAAGTIAYTGTAVTTVYALPAVTTTYQAVSNNLANCPSPATSVTVTRSCASVVDMKLYVEGYYLGGGLMKSVKLNQGVSGASATDVEDMTVKLYDATTHALVDTAVGTLQTDGTISCSFGTAPTGSFYISVEGSNSLRTWSADPVTVPTTSTYDFSSAASMAAGDNMKDLGSGVFGFYTGDINQDGNIDTIDYPLWETDSNNFESGAFPTDLDGDGNVDTIDYPIWETNSNSFIGTIAPF